jgi:hypothetical protein
MQERTGKNYLRENRSILPKGCSILELLNAISPLTGKRELLLIRFFTNTLLVSAVLIHATPSSVGWFLLVNGARIERLT